MPRTKISEYSTTNSDNTDIESINIAEGCAPSGINNAIRELMVHLKEFQTGASGDAFTFAGGTLMSGTNTISGAAVISGNINSSGTTNTFSGGNILSGTNTISGSAIISGNINSSGTNTFSGSQVFSSTANFTGTPQINGSNISAANGMRNRIINGDMRIDQRNAGASITPTVNSTYSLDRWACLLSVASKYSVQQNAGSVTLPSGFVNYLGVTSLSAYSVGASEFFSINQAIEGFNVADLGFGTANAKTITLSFQVYSSLTGTFGGSVANRGASYTPNRSYPFTYSIPVANTWTSISVTIAGDTGGTWYKDNTPGLGVNFSLGTGSTLSGTAGSWATANYRSATGATSVVGTNGATFYITGVQLEVGSVATPFERRDYGRELIMCQRYYYLHATGTNKAIGSAGYTTSNILYATVQFPVSMRAAPTTASTTGTNYYNAAFGSSNDGVNSFTLQFATEQSTLLYNNTEASGTANSYAVLHTNNASSLLAFQAEL